jgi:hypothetical protein
MQAGMSQKPSDYCTIPLSNAEHGKLHFRGERSYFASLGMNPHELVMKYQAEYLVANGWGPAAINHLEEMMLYCREGKQLVTAETQG